MTKEEEIQVGYHAYLENKKDCCQNTNPCAVQKAQQECNNQFQKDLQSREFCLLGIDVAVSKEPHGCGKCQKGQKCGKK